MTSLQKRDKWIPWYFAAFFLVIAAADAVMVTLAIRTHTGLVTDHPYEKGLAYNRIIEQAAAQKALGWRIHAELTGHTLHVTLFDRAGALLTPDTLYAQISRPTQSGMDFRAELVNGKASIAFPARGLWELRIFARKDGHDFQHTQRVIVP